MSGRWSLLTFLGVALLLVVELIPLSASVVAQDGSEPADGAYSSFFGVFTCETPPGPQGPFEDCVEAPGVGVVLSDPAGGTLGSCTTNGDGTCTISTQSGIETVVTVDPATLPEGYTVQNDAISYSVPASPNEAGGNVFTLRIILVPASGESGSGEDTVVTPVPTNASVESSTAPATEPDATETLTVDTDGSTAAIYGGDCDSDFTDEPVATLTNVREPAGENQGADGASAVETSFTTLDLPLDDILAEDHVLVVFDEDDDSVALACGAIGGILIDGSTVAFGLPAVGESRFSGVAYLSEDGEQTQATIFLAENLSAEATPTA